MRVREMGKALIEYDRAYFDAIDSHEKAYWLGFLTADGCVCTVPCSSLSVALQVGDIAHLRRLALDMGDSRIPVLSQAHGTVRLAWYSKQIVESLIRLGVEPRKSGVGILPSYPLCYERDFWRGIFDGDGCIGVQSRSRQATSYSLSLAGSRDILNGFQVWMQGFGVAPQKIVQARNQNGPAGTYVFYVCGNRQVERLLSAMYEGATRCLDRKYELYRALHEQNLTAPTRNKISFDDAQYIRAAYADGGVTHAKLAERYHLTPSVVSRIISNQVWRIPHQ
jgi:hypothetical protein